MITYITDRKHEHYCVRGPHYWDHSDMLCLNYYDGVRHTLNCPRLDCRKDLEFFEYWRDSFPVEIP